MTDGKLEVIQASLAELEELAPLFDLYRGFYGQNSDLPGARHYLAERLKLAESVVFLARRAGKAAGFTQLYPSFSSVSMRRIWILNDLFVREDFRRQGVGEALMGAAREFAQRTGARRLVLQTGKENQVGQRLYERLGWRRDELSFYYEYDL